MSIFLDALIWEFVDVPKEIIRGWRNFLLFNLNHFSILTLLKTFISPWHRYAYSYGKFFEIKKNIGVLIFNLMSRTIGAMLRSFIIIIGLLIEALIVLTGIIILIGWFLSPILLLGGFLFGLKLFIS